MLSLASPRHGVVTYFADNTWKNLYSLPQISAQCSELPAVILALQVFSFQALNLVTDPLYVHNFVLHLYSAVISSTAIDTHLMSLFLHLQALLCAHRAPLFLVHILSHQTLPSFLQQDNTIADQTLCILCPLFNNAKESHAFFHQSAHFLHELFHIPLSEAKAIVSACSHCTATPHSFSL